MGVRAASGLRLKGQPEQERASPSEALERVADQEKRDVELK